MIEKYGCAIYLSSGELIRRKSDESHISLSNLKNRNSNSSSNSTPSTSQPDSDVSTPTNLSTSSSHNNGEYDSLIGTNVGAVDESKSSAKLSSSGIIFSDDNSV